MLTYQYQRYHKLVLGCVRDCCEHYSPECARAHRDTTVALKPFETLQETLIAEAEVARLQEGLDATTIMIVCDYARKDVDEHVSEVRHEFDDVAVENVHRHIEDRYCLEVFIAEGSHQRITDLVSRIRGMRGILQVKALFMSL